VHEAARRLPHLRYADVRLEVTEAKGAGAENGAPKFSGDDYGFALGVRVLAGDRMIAPGYVGQVLGTADLADLDRIVRAALEQAYRRAMVNGEMKADTREKFGPLGEALADTRLCPIEVRQDTVDAAVGHQRGWEILLEGVDEPLLRFPTFRDFALALAREGVALAVAPVLPTSEREVVVVTDPHYNTLVSHEIIGHPVELDRALKMETAYAGRSWLLGGLTEHQVGRRVASPLVTAYSDPSLPGFGHYKYDHEGTPARRVVHIDQGIFRGFMNSRQTAAIFGGEPNGHWKATDASLVPLIRMSNTVFDAGTRAAEDLVKEVDHGYYVAGHRTPSIAESRENFRISARMAY